MTLHHISICKLSVGHFIFHNKDKALIDENTSFNKTALSTLYENTLTVSDHMYNFDSLVSDLCRTC